MADLLVQSPPRISPALFAEVLQRAGSPAAAENTGDALYHIPLSFGLDPAVALAFFQHESTYGRKGVAVTTRGWGNMRVSEGGRYPRREFFDAQGKSKGFFAVYPSYAASLADWCAYIIRRYVNQGMPSVEAIVPVYAPDFDNNKPAQYIAAVRRAVAAWEGISRAGGWVPPSPAGPWALWGDAYPLPPEQRGFAIPAAWLPRAAQLGAAVSDEVSIGTGPRRVAVRAFVGGYLLWNAQTDDVTVGGWS